VGITHLIAIKYFGIVLVIGGDRLGDSNKAVNQIIRSFELPTGRK